MGKSIAFQGLGLATGAANIPGQAGNIFRRLFGIVIATTLICAIFIMVQYYFLTWMLPG
jgi:L-lactate permease